MRKRLCVCGRGRWSTSPWNNPTFFQSMIRRLAINLSLRIFGLPCLGNEKSKSPIWANEKDWH